MVKVEVNVTNIGKVDGSEVVQLYMTYKVQWCKEMSSQHCDGCTIIRMQRYLLQTLNL